MKTIKTLKQLKRFTGSHQVTAQELINGRTYFVDKGWVSIKLSEELKQSFAKELAELYGGRNKTKQYVEYSLLHSTPQHWGLSRTLLTNRLTWDYCAGQDYTWEVSKIRKHLS